jgi:Ca2+-binding EF-hand superfamily protein
MDLLGARTARRFGISANRLIAGTLGVLVVAAALAGPGRAQAPGDPDEIFDLFDANGDGVIDRTEFDVHKIQVISAFDANRNGRLERDEVRISDENFQAADRDADGRISGYEFNESPFGKFEALDADGDGLVTREEFRTFVENLRG